MLFLLLQYQYGIYWGQQGIMSEVIWEDTHHLDEEME